MPIELKTATMKQTEREYEAMAKAILNSFEFMDKAIQDHVQPSYYVEFSKTQESAKFMCYFNDEDNKEDKRTFTLLKNDSMNKLISYVQDDYESLMTIEPNN